MIDQNSKLTPDQITWKAGYRAGRAAALETAAQMARALVYDKDGEFLPDTLDDSWCKGYESAALEMEEVLRQRALEESVKP